MMSGKAISRAVRAHLLLDAVLNGLLLSKSIDVPLPCVAGVEQDDAESSDKTPRKWRMMKPLQESKPSATATWKHWRKTQRPVCGYNTSI